MYFLFVALLSSLNIHNATAKIIHLDDLINTNSPNSLSKDITGFRNSEILEIGGTHTYGAKTKDPKTIIVNPDPDAHTKKPSKLSISGSGFNEKLLKKLHQVNAALDHRFKKIFINTIGFALPIPDRVPIYHDLDKEIATHFGLSGTSPYSISVWQQSNFSSGTALWNDGLWFGLLKYASKLEENSHLFDLYRSYFELLDDKGIFEFRSAYLPELKCAIVKGIFSYMAFDSEIVTDSECYGEFVKNEDRVFYEKIAMAVNQVGEYDLDESSYKTEDLNFDKFQTDTRAAIKAQYFLLKRAQFGKVKISFEIVKNNEFAVETIIETNGISGEMEVRATRYPEYAYQMVITAQKKPLTSLSPLHDI